MDAEARPSPEELARLNLYYPSLPGGADQLRLLELALDLGATLEELTRAVRARYNIGPLMLDLAMRPPGETLDLAEFAAGEPDEAMVRRIWSAFGLPDAASPTVRVTPDAAEAIRVAQVMIVLFGEDVAMGIARVMGSSAARLAETISGAFRVGDEVPKLNTGISHADVSVGYTDIVRDALPVFLNAVSAVFRRHLVNISYQTWDTDSDLAAVTHQRTVCFADLVGSTEALHAMSIRQMADMLRRFEEQVWDLVSARGGRVVKLIGDEAMYVLDDPAVACRVGLDLIAQSEHPVRIGMAEGTVVGLYGDYFGETVNLAARLVNLAEPSTVLVSQTVREHAGSGLTFDAGSGHVLKGFKDPVQAYRVTTAGEGSR
jgi:adenylate cyclase